jgi:regulatory protein
MPEMMLAVNSRPIAFLFSMNHKAKHCYLWMMTHNSRNNDDFTAAQQALERYCAYRDRAESEARRRLADFELSDADRDAILNSLKALNYLNDARFAESYVRGKYEIKRWGRIKIRAGLRSLSIPPNAIEEALHQLDPCQYEQTLTELAARKIAQLGGRIQDWNERQKVVRFLLQRGFETDLIMDVLNILTKDR